MAVSLTRPSKFSDDDARRISLGLDRDGLSKLGLLPDESLNESSNDRLVRRSEGEEDEAASSMSNINPVLGKYITLYSSIVDLV
jgi:hypothetical protein